MKLARQRVNQPPNDGGVAGETRLFHRVLANEGYLVASFDNRGKPAPKGRAWRKSLFGEVGVLSAQGQAEAVLALGSTWSGVDLARVGGRL